MLFSWCLREVQTSPPPRTHPLAFQSGTGLKSPKTCRDADKTATKRTVHSCRVIVWRVLTKADYCRCTFTESVLATMPSTVFSVKGSKCLSGRLMNSGFNLYPLRPLYSNIKRFSCMDKSGTGSSCHAQERRAWISIKFHWLIHQYNLLIYSPWYNL